MSGVTLTPVAVDVVSTVGDVACTVTDSVTPASYIFSVSVTVRSSPMSTCCSTVLKLASSAFTV